MKNYLIDFTNKIDTNVLDKDFYSMILENIKNLMLETKIDSSACACL